MIYSDARHHDYRNSTDDVIAGSHSGPCQVYLSPDPPADDSWVKIQSQGEYEKGKWCTTDYLAKNHASNRTIDGFDSIFTFPSSQGRLNTQIPADLAPGKYLIRPELIALHEADTQWIKNNNRGFVLILCTAAAL